MQRLFVVLVALYCAGIAHAQLFSTDAVEPLSLIAPAPAMNSAAEQDDFATILSVHAHRTPADCDKANSDANLNPVHLFGQDAALLTNREVEAAGRLLADASNTVGVFVGHLKDHWHRARPPERDPKRFKNCIPTHESYSYPSGHSAIGMSWGLVLADLYPEKSASILARAEAVGWARVIGGVHFPSDVKAGQELARKIYLKVRERPEFQAKLAAFKQRARALSSP